MNLPGKTTGSYSRNLNHLWALGAVVLLWRADFKEWYSPLLKSGVTHLDVDAATLIDALDYVDDSHHFGLRAHAKLIDEKVVSGRGLAAFFGQLFTKLRSRFGLGDVLDDPCQRARLFKAANCSRLDLVSYAAPAASPFPRPVGGLPATKHDLPVVPTDCNAIYKRARDKCAALRLGGPRSHPAAGRTASKAAATWPGGTRRGQGAGGASALFLGWPPAPPRAPGCTCRRGGRACRRRTRRT